jgi:hypothetical protein
MVAAVGRPTAIVLLRTARIIASTLRIAAEWIKRPLLHVWRLVRYLATWPGKLFRALDVVFRAIGERVIRGLQIAWEGIWQLLARVRGLLRLAQRALSFALQDSGRSAADFRLVRIGIEDCWRALVTCFASSRVMRFA